MLGLGTPPPAPELVGGAAGTSARKDDASDTSFSEELSLDNVTKGRVQKLN